MDISHIEMRHSIHMFFGDKYASICKDLKSYAIKYGDENSNKYFSSVLCLTEDNKLSFKETVIVKEDRTTFKPGVESLYESNFDKLIVEDEPEYIKEYFERNLFRPRVINNHPGESNRLSVCMYIPLYEEDAWSIASRIIDSIDGKVNNIDIDIFILSPDTADIFQNTTHNDPSTKDYFVLLEGSQKQELSQKLISDIISFQSSHKASLKHIVLMQNYNAGGYALNLNYNAFLRIIGEYGLITMGSYDTVFNNNAQDEEKPIHALGLSVLSLDKFDYIQYMLHRAYIYLMDREKVNEEKVNINSLSVYVQEKLSKRVKVFSDIYNSHLIQLINKGVHGAALAATIDTIVDNELKTITHEFQDYLYDDKKSIPEKRATLAQLLGEDDALFSGQQFDEKQLILDDCSEEVMQYLIEANNNLLSQNSSDITENCFPDSLHLNSYAAFSESGKQVQFILKELKSLRVQIRRCTSGIRKKQKELEQIKHNYRDIQEEVKVLTDHGFEYGGVKFKVIERIEERPLEKTYQPLDNISVISVDLRGEFTSIKSQGETGSCVAHAFVSVYEYILNKNSKLDADLSERFLYYNTRKLNGNTEVDCGSTLYDAAKSLETFGLCSEELCPYSSDFKDHTLEPSESAYIDASTRKVAEVMNVKIEENAIKSAIMEGYPVICSINLHESFNNISHDGFVKHPQEGETSVGWHAMVIVGYNDKNRVFVLRNSWGSDFGDGGYCYLPYSYILDQKLNSMCCIITRVSCDDIEVKGDMQKLTVQFDESNTKVRISLLEILLDDAKRQLGSLNSHYSSRIRYYYDLFEDASDSIKRKQIEEGTERRLKWEQTTLVNHKEKTRCERIEMLDKMRQATIKGHWFFAALFALIVISYMFLNNYSGEILTTQGDLINTVSHITLGLSGMLAIGWVIWTSIKRKNKKQIDQEYKNKLQYISSCIDKRQVLLANIHITFHLAGAIVDKLTDLSYSLHSKYHGMVSFTNNLKVWYKEESEKLSNLNLSVVSDPFISVLKEESLQKFFELKASGITENLRLYNLFKDNYTISDPSIVEFKYKLKDIVINTIIQTLNEFSIYQYLTSAKEFLFLDADKEEKKDLLTLMDFKSQPFVRMRQQVAKRKYSKTFVKLLFLNADFNTDLDEWDKMLNDNFRKPPILGEIESPYKMTLVQMQGLSLDQCIDFSNS